MKKLIVISDLWGVKQSQWWQYYTETLSKHFEVIFYDACQLGQIDVSQYTEVALHQQFMDGGVLQSVQNLAYKEKETFAILGFSIGGYIAWRALHSGLKAQHLVAVSSTRLRYETIPPKAQLHLFYGKKDHHLPSTAWYDTMKTSPYLFDEAYHNFYQKKYIAQQICEYIENKML
ncbi:alpha/beta hydrolase [Capnocytophaga canis]|uniref:alpha/beta hydrolase n=1 Tax=Capnocytophaga canis TaxID=1848903 RepID=UPI00370D322D